MHYAQLRIRRFSKKFVLMKANIQAVARKIQTLRIQNSMAVAMKGVTKALMAEFEKQTEIMDIKEEIMNDYEEESNTIVAQVLDELGIQVNEKLSEIPTFGGSLPVGTSQSSTEQLPRCSTG
uniref:Charged multivesicular body protein 2a n=1 Tax=Tetranychus urticae TaxID=32264 RepID=T1JUZ2_TETUR